MATSRISPGSRRTTWNAFSWAGGSPASGGKVTYNCGTAFPRREPTFLTTDVAADFASEHRILAQVLPGTPSTGHPCDVHRRRKDRILASGEDFPAERRTVTMCQFLIEARRHRQS
jgi:hypothetical protein